MPYTTHVIQTTQYGNLVDVVIDGTTYEFSDHKRDPVSVDTERIEITRRTSKGKRRRYHVADKVSFSVSWTDLPGLTSRTVDGKMGVNDLEDMYILSLAKDAVTVNFAEQDGGTTSYTCHIVDFSKQIKKRFKDDYYYDVTIDFEEV